MKNTTDRNDINTVRGRSSTTCNRQPSTQLRRLGPASDCKHAHINALETPSVVVEAARGTIFLRHSPECGAVHKHSMRLSTLDSHNMSDYPTRIFTTRCMRVASRSRWPTAGAAYSILLLPYHETTCGHCASRANGLVYGSVFIRLLVSYCHSTEVSERAEWPLRL